MKMRGKKRRGRGLKLRATLQTSPLEYAGGPPAFPEELFRSCLELKQRAFRSLWHIDQQRKPEILFLRHGIHILPRAIGGTLLKLYPKTGYTLPAQLQPISFNLTVEPQLEHFDAHHQRIIRISNTLQFAKRLQGEFVGAGNQGNPANDSECGLH